MRFVLEGKTALVTGASAGIGVALAHALAPKVKRLVLVARRREQLQAVAAAVKAKAPAVEVQIEPADLGRSSEVDALADRVSGVDVLVNNAGLGKNGWYHSTPWSDIEQIVRVNVLAVLQLTRRLVPAMVEKKSGAIVNVSSGLGFVPGVKDVTYVGTKWFINGFSESLRAELEPHGVVVCQVAPGPVESEFAQRAGIRGGDIPGGPPRSMKISAEQCAAESVAGLERGAAVVFPGGKYRLLMALAGMVPRAMLRRSAVREARSLVARGR